MQAYLYETIILLLWWMSIIKLFYYQRKQRYLFHIFKDFKNTLWFVFKKNEGVKQNFLCYILYNIILHYIKLHCFILYYMRKVWDPELFTLAKHAPATVIKLTPLNSFLYSFLHTFYPTPFLFNLPHHLTLIFLSIKNTMVWIF